MKEHDTEDGLKAFLLVLRQGLLLIVRYIEKAYGLNSK